MNKLVACAVLGLGLTQVLVGCGDDDDSGPIGVSGSTSTAGKGGTASAGTSAGGKASGGTAGTGGATGGKAGSSTGGTNSGGTNSGGAGGEAVGGEGGIGGDTGAGGDNMGGAGGQGPVELETATTGWLGMYCLSTSEEALACEGSLPFDLCYYIYRPFVMEFFDGTGCSNDDDSAKGLAVMAALDGAATYCPDPQVDDWSCDINDAPRADSKECRDAEAALAAAYSACAPE